MPDGMTVPKRDKTLATVNRLLDRDPTITFVPVTQEVVNQMDEWSEPLEVLAVTRDDGLVELNLRRPLPPTSITCVSY